jgi:hypothetical protein
VPTLCARHGRGNSVTPSHPCCALQCYAGGMLAVRYDCKMWAVAAGPVKANEQIHMPKACSLTGVLSHPHCERRTGSVGAKALCAIAAGCASAQASER